MRNISWQQVAVIALCLAAPVVGYHFGGAELAGGMHAVTTILAWFTKQPDSTPPDQEAK